MSPAQRPPLRPDEPTGLPVTVAELRQILRDATVIVQARACLREYEQLAVWREAALLALRTPTWPTCESWCTTSPSSATGCGRTTAADERRSDWRPARNGERPDPVSARSCRARVPPWTRSSDVAGGLARGVRRSGRRRQLRRHRAARRRPHRLRPMDELRQPHPAAKGR